MFIGEKEEKNDARGGGQTKAKKESWRDKSGHHRYDVRKRGQVPLKPKAEKQSSSKKDCATERNWARGVQKGKKRGKFREEQGESVQDR